MADISDAEARVREAQSLLLFDFDGVLADSVDITIAVSDQTAREFAAALRGTVAPAAQQNAQQRCSRCRRLAAAIR